MIDLVAQGPVFASGQRDTVIEALSELTGVRALEAPHGCSVRFRDVAEDRDILAHSAALGCDLAFVPATAALEDFRLLAMDMDSTLITIECVDELADVAGIKPQVALITQSAMRGEIPFSDSLRRRIALLGGLHEHALARVYEERLRLSPGAEILLRAACTCDIATLLVSGGFTYFTDRLRDRLGIDRACANSLEVVDGVLTGRILGKIFDGESKAAAVREMSAQLGAQRHEILVIGDGANDLPMMDEAGVSIAFRAKPVVRARAAYALDYSGLDGVLNLFPQRTRSGRPE